MTQNKPTKSYYNQSNSKILSNSFNQRQRRPIAHPTIPQRPQTQQNRNSPFLCVVNTRLKSSRIVSAYLPEHNPIQQKLGRKNASNLRLL